MLVSEDVFEKANTQLSFKVDLNVLSFVKTSELVEERSELHFIT